LKNDPFADREAKRYINPIPSREFILQHIGEAGLPISFKRLSKELELETPDSRDALKRRLRAMVKEGQLVVDGRNIYQVAGKKDLISGKVVGHADGYGFLIPDEGADDLYISARQMRQVLHGDHVLARTRGLDFRGRLKAEIVEVTSQSIVSLVGIYNESDGECFVQPLNRKITHRVIVPRRSAAAKKGQAVIVEMTEHPFQTNTARGVINQVLGDRMAPGMETEIAILNHAIPNDWPKEVQQESVKIGPEVKKADKKGRKDLRDRYFVTIDGEDAKDFDDAVYCEKKSAGGWRLFVAIADVAHYVRPESSLDREAFQRGNSVYFPQLVVPMLPEKLSNGLCSLKPLVDRLCMVCEMTISSRGKLSGYRFYEAVIHSHARLTYTQVSALLSAAGEGETAVDEVHSGIDMSGIDAAELWPHLKVLYSLYRQLTEARKVRGAIEFDTTETTFIFDSEGNVENIKPVIRNEAHRLIEECMLMANVSTAKFLGGHKLHGLYRVHEGPSPEKLNNLREFLAEYGLNIGGGEIPRPADYQFLLDQIQGMSNSHALQTVLLRSLSQAVYQAENLGHFGLNYAEYAHFTSPIRRYPDLLNHRAIKSIIHSKKRSVHVERPGGIAGKEPYPYEKDEILLLGDHCSMTERRADAATYEVVDVLKCRYVERRIGESFDAVITAVTGFGFFVELDGLFVEGLVHVSTLMSDYYSYDAGQHALIGERSGRTYCIGDRVRVQIARVSVDERKIDCELISHHGRKQKKRKAVTGSRRHEGKSGRGGKRGTRRKAAKGQRSRKK
jgi:ribonuclease R